MNRVADGALGLMLCAALSGCGGGEARVSGTVTLDSQPVPNGSIQFVGDGGVREGAVIKDGAFTAKLAPGKYKVEVRATRVTGKRKQKGFDGKDEEVELTEEMIPDRYNAKTELTEDLKSGSNTVTLDLKGKK